MSERAEPVVATLEDVDNFGRGLRLEFLRLSDRHAHRILAVGFEDAHVTLLESVEGKPADAWPPSPALQALNIDELVLGKSTSASPVAMLVGMSGKTHWSLSVEPYAGRLRGVEVRSNTVGGMLFKAACRLKEPAPVVGSRYSLGRRVRAEATPTGLRLQFGSGNCSLCRLAGAGASDDLAWHYDHKQHQAYLSLPTVDRERFAPTTYEWHYELAAIDA